MEIDRTFARIHLDNLVFNYNQVQDLIGDSLVMAVVKADAYGHGSVKCARRLEANGCKFFAVASLQEAIELREAGIKGDILIFGRTSYINHCYLSKYNLVQTVYSLDYAKELNECQDTIRIHINIDTGMSRFGLYLHEDSDIKNVVEDIRKITKLKNLNFEGIYTHFADSDDPDSDFSEVQFTLFKKLLDNLNEVGIDPGIKHVANSAALLAYPNTYLDMVRLGIAMYGYPPVETKIEFKPVMEVFSRVTSVRGINHKDTVSYGRTYHSNQDTNIATIAIGYADGYNRLLSNKDYLIYKNKKLPLLGRVCMDAIMVDIKDQIIKDGDYVEVFGFNKPLMSMCDILHTIPYELLCNVSKRVPRLYD
ncbi:alanine racemase [Mycoplasmatota bacterium WC30]